MSALLTQEQVRRRCRDAGFGKMAARVASAIAMCEAPGPMVNGVPTSDFSLVGDQHLANNTWGYSYGGFQVRSLRAHKGTGEYRDEDRLLDVTFNVASAQTIRREQGWEAWSVYRTGMFKAYLQDLYPPPPNTYVVMAGDTLSSIAAKLGGFTWEDLARANGLHTPYTVYIGQHLILP